MSPVSDRHEAATVRKPPAPRAAAISIPKPITSSCRDMDHRDLVFVIRLLCETTRPRHIGGCARLAVTAMQECAGSGRSYERVQHLHIRFAAGRRQGPLLERDSDRPDQRCCPEVSNCCMRTSDLVGRGRAVPLGTRESHPALSCMRPRWTKSSFEPSEQLLGLPPTRERVAARPRRRSYAMCIVHGTHDAHPNFIEHAAMLVAPCA